MTLARSGRLQCYWICILITMISTDATKICGKTCKYSLLKGSSHNRHEGILHAQDPTNHTNWLPVCWTKLNFTDQKCLHNTIDPSSTGLYDFPDGVFNFPNTTITNSLVHLTQNLCNSHSQNTPVCNPLAICLQSSHISNFGPSECSRNWTGAQSKKSDKHCHNGHTLSMSRIRGENTTQFAGRAWTASGFQIICGGDNETIIKNIESGLNRCLQDWNTRRDQPNNYVIIDQNLTCSWSSKRPCPRDEGLAFELIESEDHNATNYIYCIAADMTEGLNFTLENCTTLLPPFCGKTDQSPVTHADNPTQPPTDNTVKPATTSSHQFITEPTDNPQSQKVLVISITVPTALLLVIAACCCNKHFRKMNRSSGDSPSKNSMVNQTYGAHPSATYHLLDESKLEETPNPPLPMRNKVHELSVLDAYSTPHDSIVHASTRVDYELTYEDQLKCERKGQTMITEMRNEPCALINSRPRDMRKALSEDKPKIDSSIVDYNCLHDSLPKDYKRGCSLSKNARIKKLRSEGDICYHTKNQRIYVEEIDLKSSIDAKTDFLSVSLNCTDSTMKTVVNETQISSSVETDVNLPQLMLFSTPQMKYSDCISTNKKVKSWMRVFKRFKTV